MYRYYLVILCIIFNINVDNDTMSGQELELMNNIPSPEVTPHKIIYELFLQKI